MMHVDIVIYVKKVSSNAVVLEVGIWTPQGVLPRAQLSTLIKYATLNEGDTLTLTGADISTWWVK